MNQHLALIALVIEDYDSAIHYFTEILNFRLEQDTKLSDEKRWVVVKPKGTGNCGILLAKAANENQKEAIGNQSGGRVFLFLHTDNFDRDFENYVSKQVEFVRLPSIEPYGKVAVFIDKYGNLWDLIEPI